MSEIENPYRFILSQNISQPLEVNGNELESKTMSQIGTTAGRAELAAILDLAAQQEGAIRLLVPRTPGNNEIGLFPSSEGKHGEYQKELIGTLLEEVLGRPRMVKLTKRGIEILVRNTPQDERPALIDRASVLYRPRMLAAWKEVAIQREQDMLRQSIDKHFGEWFLVQKDESASEFDNFKQKLARELAESWSEATSDEARKRLSYFLRMVGAKPFEKENTTVTFSGLTHKPKVPLFKGDTAVVLRSGWTLTLPSEDPIILLKAEVTTPS